jgi:hypothetical protein
MRLSGQGRRASETVANKQMSPFYSDLEKYPDGVVISQGVTIGKRRTTLYLNIGILLALREIEQREGVTLNEICALVEKRKSQNEKLVEAVRSYVLRYFREATTEEGHRIAGHGCTQSQKGTTEETVRRKSLRR